MGVLKAHGAFILLDASQPIDRLQAAINEDFPDSIILATTNVSAVAAKISEKIILLDTLEKEECGALDAQIFPTVSSPSTAAYAVYTSGSTGKPKASIIGHGCFVTAAAAHGQALGIGPGTRVLQFASFAFDACIVEILTTLLMGGCVCVPSETDRSQKLAGFIASKRVNWALLTPSVSRILEPREVPTLRTLVLGGEEVRAVDVQRWSPHVTLMNAYGPSECSVIATIQTSSSALLEDPCNIGPARGALAWVVDSQDPVRLVPFGAVGELLIEGPIVGQGYINRTEQTAAAFNVRLPWMEKMHRIGTSRSYRTGDLVRMLPDGSLRYEGRKDRQVKLHGQRVELSEVERHVRECFPDSQQLFAELVQCKDTGEQRLVAYVQQETLDEDQFDRAVSRAQDILPRRNPSFLVPSIFVRLREVPRLPSGKVDQLQLRRAGLVAIRKTRISRCQGSRRLRRDKPRALTSCEQRLRDLWADLLHLPTSKIDAGDHFFSLGGDSIMAMRLVSSAPSHGMELTVADVFLHPRLRNLARVLEGRGIQSLARVHGAADAEEDPSPFSLLPTEREADIKLQAVAQCGVALAQIEDIYPCTPMQAGLAAISTERPGAYVGHHAYSIPVDPDPTRLRQAWDRVADKHPILRTRLIRATNMGCVQVVIRNSPPQWHEVCSKSTGVSLAQVDRLPDPSHDGIFGVPLVHVSIRKHLNNDGVCSNCTMVLTMHHSVYDAWSLPRLLSAVEKAYGQDGPSILPKPAPFQRFIQYISSQTEAALKFWRTEFDDLSAEPFPGLPSPSYRPSAVSQLDQTFPTGSFTTELATRTTAVRLAWAVVQSQYQGQSDVVFGIVSSGRTAPVHGVQTMTSPTIVAIPLRVRTNPHMEFKGALAALQDWTARVVPFEQAGLQQIARLGPNATRACSFQTLLNIEQAEESLSGQANGLFSSVETTAAKGAFATYALVLHCRLELQAVRVCAVFDEKVIPQWKMQRIVNQFGHVLQMLHQGQLRFVGDAAGSLNERDREQLIEWNSTVPHLMAETVPSAIRQQIDAQPDVQAVCAFDGDFTYRELDAWSDMLKRLLHSCHIQPGSLIPIYIDRSRWAIIAMLGIVKARAAFVLLDTSHPHSRLRTICDEIKAPLLVTSQDRLATAISLPAGAAPICVGECLNSPPQDLYTADMKSTLCHTDALYAMFTSGSTGKPKGVVIEHGALVAMTREYSQRVGLGPGARVLHFGSYAFDVSILETLCTLIAGACVCIPSESSRQEGFAEALRKLGPSHALLTPSFLRGLLVHDLAPIQTLMLVGEPPRRDEVDRWSPKLRLMNLYGPAECTILAALQPQARPGVDPTNIGHPVAGTAWITNPQDPRHLAPIGAVGELLLQGPMVGRGYLNDPELTATAFLQAPPWLAQFGVGNGVHNGRVYRTGDLVRFEQDGTLVYLGRKDFQVKLRGQRLELSEVEDHVLREFPGSLKDVAAEVVTPADDRPNPCLVAFLVPALELLPSQSSSTSSVFPLQVATPEDFDQKIHTTHSRMHTYLPDYMVPVVFVPLSELPRTVGGKIDRRQLREAAASVTRQQLEAVGSSFAEVEKAPMASDAERSLQGIWAEVLGIVRSAIGAEDSFFRLGGDSISALQATSQARAVSIEHSVPDLFRWKTIREIVKRFAKASGKMSIGHELSHPLTNRGDDKLGGVAVYPCTPVQQGVLLTQISDPGSYAPHFIWKIHRAPPSDGAAVVDPNRLAAAWQQVVNRHSALRTVFRRDTSTDDGVFELHILPQIECPVQILPGSDTDSEGLPVRLTELHPQVTAQQSGQMPHDFAICPCKNGEVFCRLDINHAIIDAISVGLLELDILQVYENGSRAPNAHDAYQEYLQYVHRQPQDPAREYWRTYLAGIQPVILPRSRADGQPASTPQRLEIPLTCSGTDIDAVCHRTDWTPSNLLYFAWGLTVGSFTGSDDVVFGTLTSGRHIPIPHIEQTVGQISNMAVCRVHIPSHRLLDDAAIALQEDYGRVLAFHSFPLSQMSRACGVTVQELASTAINVQYALSATPCKDKNFSISLTPVTGLDPTLVSCCCSTLGCPL
jgi:amino acid adenylation domain-containing protein